MLLRLVTGIALSITLLNAQQPASRIEPSREKPAPLSKTWLTSAAFLVAASTLDATSSWGKYETNPFLRSPDGRFGARGISIKLSFTAAMLVPQILLRKNHTAVRLFTISNFAQAGVYSAIAKHNYGISSPPGQ